MHFKPITIIEDHSDQDETIIYEHEGWIQADERMAWYVDQADSLLIMADIKSYKVPRIYEIFPSSIVIFMLVPEGESFELEDLELFVEKLQDMSVLEYFKVLAERISDFNYGFERLFY